MLCFSFQYLQESKMWDHRTFCSQWVYMVRSSVFWNKCAGLLKLSNNLGWIDGVYKLLIVLAEVKWKSCFDREAPKMGNLTDLLKQDPRESLWVPPEIPTEGLLSTHCVLCLTPCRKHVRIIENRWHTHFNRIKCKPILKKLNKTRYPLSLIPLLIAHSSQVSILN